MATLDTSAPATRRSLSLGMSPIVVISAAFLVFMVFVAIFAEWLAPIHYTTQNLAARLRPPLTVQGDFTYYLGTDQLGRDILSRLIYAIRTSILIAVLGTLLGAVVGTLLGFVAARLRGLPDQAIMMLVDTQAAIPALLLALTMLAFFGNNVVLFIILVSLDGWEKYTRLARGLVVSEQTSDYINAVEALGARSGRVIFKHLLPNIVAALVVQATLNFPGTILLETSLSFLGLGVQPPGTSLGLMLGEGRRHLLNAWWIAVFPGCAIFLTTLAMSLFGDWLRDRLDPTVDRG
ncbi:MULTISPECIES: ABC transporter permease [unclassified Chelatococcus]|uniref:ABC transporter permease n=1 Tax=unclassified Chelatococcus TaxID=2638111 RepID=UPI001BCB11E5|nr:MULTISPECIES: ABC transporter permease [unclassified Chelatococcus]CAH1647995.1 Dipeptide transport system permease protein DppC [Hyphomicrobiales bacterium]MBS7742104.1 ABC transporter permease [Chelatococcus sp. HY11]MBX3542778.1 ABC transporter permease [Chelatococcus sp.]MCO5075007.1 ABC transporter permease [Chelatococcus sp.]CAH1690173.1 Dipeptide transport system permease protein DppC [Hyphomicrobiales bacterium]